ncbi:type III secretion system export apparatus subunit SctU [Propionivibrio dicarboxylicus]|uniref:Type III secretion protein U n=1 Tax=Propionivibrio dicarboxylicus TaxID=83767 RepID=A0A1G7WTH7_9RHOO|nr:type III secretion system export apparatus subunit SctU [Propionivibrio dicarboxylicus]SDG75222.1 type III secretion protein U [Propionivibrio dicarboxylicus]
MSEKTEQPTGKKIRQARDEGQVAKSKDFTQTVLILAMFAYLLGSAERIVESLGEMMLLPLGALALPFEDAASAVLRQLVKEALSLLLPFLLIVIGLGLFVEMAQTRMLFAFKALKPSAKKLNAIANLKNIFAVRNLIELLKSVLKIGCLAALIYSLLRAAIPELLTLPQGGIAGVGVGVAALLRTLIVNVAVVYAAIAAADFVFQRRQYTKGLMMAKDEVKQEYKEMEGSPEIKQHRRRLHQELLNQGAVDRARKATVLVTNPSHLAIALHYDKDETPLPMVIAKGEGALAERMIEAAREAGVPVLQNIPLAHQLMREAAIEHYIPSALVEPVAEVLRLVRDFSMHEGDHGGT